MTRFARLESEQLDANDQLHIKVVENERCMDSMAQFHDRVRRVLMDHLIGQLFDKKIEDLRVRWVDTNTDVSLQLMKATIAEVITELIEANTNSEIINKLKSIDQTAIFEKLTSRGSSRVIVPQGPWDEKYQLNLSKIIPTR